MAKWKSKEDGTHFNSDKKKRDAGHYEITETEVKSNFEPMYDDMEKFAKEKADSFAEDMEDEFSAYEKREREDMIDLYRTIADDAERLEEESKRLDERDKLTTDDFVNDEIYDLKLALHDADRRYEIAISRISEITKRLHELEIARNLALRKQLLENEIKKNPDPNLIKEYNEINADDRDIEIYQEVANGYKSMSRRKNELQEERNQYVKEIEELERKES